MPRPFIPVPNTVSVEMIYGCYAQVMENCYHVKSNVPFDAGTIATLRGVFNTWDSGSVANLRPNNVYLNRIRTKALDTSSSYLEDYFLPAPRAGGAAGAAAPLGSTIAIKLGTGLAGRSYRGRIYVPGLPLNIISGNQVGSGYHTNWANGIQALITQITAANANWKLAVVSYMADGVWRTTGVATVVTYAVATDANIDSQRRRLTGRGLA